MDGSHKAELVVAGAAATAEVTATVASTHAAIQRRIAKTLPPVAPLLLMQRAHAQAIYSAVRFGARLVQAAATVTARQLERRQPTPPAAVTHGFFAAISCAFGDHLAASVPSLAPTMGIFHDGRPVAATPRDLRQAFGPGPGRLVVFLHGLGDTERGWSARGSLPELVDGTGRHTALRLRYNSGLHISENGELLAELLQQLRWAWPTPVSEIMFVGHSMGGLVVRSACETARRMDHDWRHLVTNVFYLGAPHHGSGVERVAAAALGGLSRIPEARPFVELANRRSAGIKDLRYGSVVPEDWAGHPDRRDERQHVDVPLLPTARHHQVGATILPSGLAFADPWIGDVMVPLASALADRPRAGRQPFPQDDSHVIRGVSHPGLAGHPRTEDLLAGHLAGHPAAQRDRAQR